jgi:putative hemolysin
LVLLYFSRPNYCESVRSYYLHLYTSYAKTYFPEVEAMRFITLFALAVIVIAGCQNQNMPNPASVNCEKQGGTLKIVTDADGQKGICTLPDGTECDEWAYMRGECPLKACTMEAKLCPDGSSVGRQGPDCEFAACPSPNASMPNPASVFCTANGGTFKIVTEEAGQRGICTLPDGTECDEWAYMRGECPVKDCPQIMPPGPNFCPDGKIVAGDVDDNGCQGPPKCEPVACTMEAKICPDGSSVGRQGPECEFAPCPTAGKIRAFDCTEEQRDADVCTADYTPVCGFVQIQCITTPCEPVHQTFSNACEACKNPLVLSYTIGECGTEQR